MSLSDIGNIIKQINKLKKFDTWEEAADKAGDICQKLAENLTEMPEMANKVRKELSFSDEILDIADISDAIENVTDAASDGTSVVSKFGSSLKGAFSSIGGTIAAHPIIATIAAITAALAIRAAVVEDATEKMDKALQSQSEHKDTLSEIDSINSELETTQQRIDELNAKENLSFVEKAELSDLQTANAELEKQLELKEKLARKQAIQAAEDAKDAINNRSVEKAFDTGTDDWYSKLIKWSAGISDKLGFQDLPNSGLGAIALFGGATEEASNGGNLFKILYDKIDQLNEAETELKKLENSLSTDDTDRERAKKESAIEKQQEKIRGLESVIASQYSDLEQLSSAFYYEDENGIKHAYENYVAYAKAFEIIQEKYLATGSSEANTKAIDTEKAIEGVFSKVKFDGVKEKFVELGQVGRASLEEELSSGNYESLIETISNALGMDEDKTKSMLSDYIMSIADPDALKIDEIKEQLRSTFSDDEYEINLRAGENADRVWEEWTKDMSDEDWEILYSIKQENDTSTWEIEDWENAFKNVKNGADEAKNTISDLVDETQTFVTQINSVQSALSEQSTGKSISLESFNSDELKDYQSALEYVNGSLQLNEEKVTAITKAKADEIIATNQANKAHKQSEYLQNATEIEDLRAKLKTLNEGTVEYTNTKHQLDSLMSENIAIASECRQYDLLTASIKEATSAYQNWLANQNTTESGDMFDSSMDAMQAIDDVADSESDDYGRIGTKKYKSAVEFIVPDTIDKDDAVAVQNYIDSIGKYFDYDENGERVGMDITQFCNDAVKQGLMNIETDVEGNEFFNLADGVEIEDFAEKLNLSSATIQAFFGEMEEFGGEFDWADEAIQTVGDLGVKAYESADALRSIDDYSDMEIKMDVSDIEDVDDKVSALDSTIQEMNNLKVKVPVDSSEAQYANDIIQYCVAQKQKLTEPVFMDIDVSQVDGDLSEIISLVQQLQTAKNDLDIKAAVGADTTEAQGKVDNLVQQIQEKSPQIKATIGEIDTSNVDTILADVSAKSVEAWVNLGVNDTAITGYVPENKEATVTYKLDSSLVDAYNPLNLNRTVTYSIVTKGVVPSVNGTAHVNGTAFANGSLRIPTDATFRNRIGRALANGNWGVDKSETALVGELGRELVVYGNRYWTVGDTGAEFTHIPKGAIVFNHKQTDEIFRNGYVTSGGGRGKAYAQGTAYVTGGIGVKNANKTAAVSSSSPSSSSTTSSSTKSTDANTTAVETNTETIEEVSENLKDWAEIYVDRIIDSLSKFKDTIDRLEVARNQNASID